LALEVAPAKTVYRPREKVEVEVRATGPGGQPLAAALSLSVTDAGKVKYDEVGTEHIAAYLLLSSEVKGDIEGPGYYFQPMTKEVHDALDLAADHPGLAAVCLEKAGPGRDARPQPLY
jgi:hypothetical protein